MNDDLRQSPEKTGWKAAWIWIPESEGYPSRNSYAFFRKKFQMSGPAVMQIAADTRYEVWLDDERIGRGTAPSVIAYKAFDTYNLELGLGEHVICVLVHHIGEVCATAEKSRPGLLAEITGPGGESVYTGPDWKTLPGRAFRQDFPGMMSHFGFQEECDFALFPEGWTETAFDDSDWLDAEVIGKPGCEPWMHLLTRDIPQLSTKTIRGRVIRRGNFEPDSEPAFAERMAKSGRTVTGEGSFPIKLGDNEFAVIDFGREVTGHVRLIFEGARGGQRIDVGYDELLDDNGIPNPKRTYVRFADTFRLRSDQTMLEVFDARGFRYLLIDVPAGNGGLTLTSAEIDERTYPVSHKGSFRCSDPVLNELYETSLETTRLCMLDTYVDCPSRERVLWMDCYLEGLCSAYGMGITELWRRVLYLFAQDRCKGGELPGAIKAYTPSDNEPVLVTYMLYYICSVSDYVLMSGDLDTGKRLFAIIEDQFALLENYGGGILKTEKWPSWGIFLDWSAMDVEGVSAGLSFLYLKALRKAEKLAAMLGMDTAEMKVRSAKAQADMSHMFRSDEEGLFVDTIKDGIKSPVISQLTNAMAIWAGAVEGDEARELIKRITDKKRLLEVTPGDYRLKPDFKPQTGGIVPIGTPGLATILGAAMFSLGMDDEALDYFREHWPPITVNGTFAEHFGFDSNTSMCQGWSAAPVMLLPKYVLGVTPCVPGWEKVKIEPHFGDLAWAEGTVPTPHGDIRVSWKRDGEKTDLKVDLPPGVELID